MPKQFVKDLQANVKVASPFVIKEKSLAPFRNKPGQYLNLTLGDATGEVKARVWDQAEEVEGRINIGDVVMVNGGVEAYQGQLQVNVKALVIAEEGTYEESELIPRSRFSSEELLARLDEVVAEVGNRHLRALLDSFVTDPQFRARLAETWGAKSLHHAYRGGLLEHTLSVVAILKTVAEIHEMNRDLLITAGLLHDIGKMEELEGKLAVHYTDIGRFVGHTVLTDRMVRDRIASLEGFPEDLANLLAHALLSHHGEKEWGAPVVPATMEACALHYADNLDARVQGFKQVIEAAEGGSGNWSEFHRSYQRAIYLRSAEDAEGGRGAPAPT